MGKTEKGGYFAEALGLTTAVDMYYQLKNMKKRQVGPRPILRFLDLLSCHRGSAADAPSRKPRAHCDERTHDMEVSDGIDEFGEPGGRRAQVLQGTGSSRRVKPFLRRLHAAEAWSPASSEATFSS
jgi:hypothetical protein